MKLDNIEQHQPSEVELIVMEILERIKHSPEDATAIGNLLIEYAERDVAEAMKELSDE